MTSKHEGRKQSEKLHTQRTWWHDKQRFGTLPFDKLVAPAVGIFDTPTRCYEINEEWSSIVMGLVSLLTETRMWQGAKDESFPAIREVQKFLEGGNCMAVLDCLDVENCLETSEIIDAIIIYNYSSQYENTQAHLDELTAAYDGTAQSIGSNIPTGAANLDSFHDNALCRVLELMVGAYAGGKGVQFVLQSDIQRWWQRMMVDVRVAFPIVPNYLLHLLGDELFGCAADVATALIALADNIAILDVACCLYDELRGVAMTETAWNAALAACASALTGNAQIIVCLMQGDNSQEHYLSFLEVYSGILQNQTDGTDYACQCAPAGWFWVDVDFEYDFPVHGGNVQSPVLTHTNPSNGELHSIVHRFQWTGADSSTCAPVSTGLPDQILAAGTTFIGAGLSMTENEFVGAAEGRDTVGWPSADFYDIDYFLAPRQPGITWTLKWSNAASAGHVASGRLSGIRLLYEEIP